jgi:hypothetical protein
MQPPLDVGDMMAENPLGTKSRKQFVQDKVGKSVCAFFGMQRGDSRRRHATNWTLARLEMAPDVLQM